jgi:hypothetical protein
MYLRYGLIAESVSESQNSKKVIVGTFDVIHGRQFPAVQLQMVLLLRIEGHGTEEGEHGVRIEMVDSDYRPVGAVSEGKFALQRQPGTSAGAPPAAEVVVNAAGTPLPHPGDYEFVVQVDGRHLGAIPLYVRQIAQ